MLVSLDCTRCSLASTRIRVVPPDAPPGRTRVLFLGRDPGAQEDKDGRPLIGPAGRLLRSMAVEAGIPPDVCAWDNVVHCHTPKNRGPTAWEVQQCRVWVRRVVEAIAPEVVVLLGQEALEAYFNPGAYRPKKPVYTLGLVHGQVLGGTPPVIPVMHPSAALRNNAFRRQLAGDLRAVARHLGYAPNEPLDGVVTHPRIPSWSFSTVAVDTESRMGTKEFILSAAAWRDAAGTLHAAWEPGPDGLARVLAACPLVVVHNLQYELGVHEQLGLLSPDQHIEDTMLRAYAHRLDQRAGGLGLKELASRLLGLTWDTLETLGLPESVPVDVLGRYCMQDAVATLLLWEYEEEL